MPLITRLLSIGSEKQQPSEADRTKITNLMSLITFVLTIAYLIVYLLIFDSKIMGVINGIYIFAYLVPLLLNKYYHYQAAKTSYFLFLISHIFILSNYTFTLDAGFTVYLIGIIPSTHIFYNYRDSLYKGSINTLAILVIFLSEMINNQSPLIPLSDFESRLLFQSSIFILLMVLLAVNHFFARDISRRELEFERLVSTDPLTKLYNRRDFSDTLKQQFELAQRYQRVFSIIFIDIDYFKSINDRFGHAAGDIVLQEIAKLFKIHSRANDHISRIGGEEFSIILPETDIDDAYNMAESLRKSVENHIFIVGNKQSIKITISLGLQKYGSNLNSTDQLLELTDQALYRAKKAGRNNTQK
jgi:diguanylate cyclase